MRASKTQPVSSINTAITVILFAVAAVWLTLQIMAMRTLVAGAVLINPAEVVNLILGLSGLVVGILYAGGVAGVTMVTTGRRYLGFLKALPRPVTALLGGLLVALVMAAAGYFVFAQTPGLGVLIAGVAGFAGLLGGGMAALRSSHLVVAGLAGTAVLLVVFFLRGYFTPELLELLGRGISSYRTLTISSGLVAGLCVGITAFLYLRREAPKTGLYGYIGAGAAAGLLWLVGELITQLAATQLATPNSNGQIDLDSLSLQLSAQSQFNGGMTALFAGATTAVLAFGLLTPRQKEVTAAPPTKKKSSAKKATTVKPKQSTRPPKGSPARSSAKPTQRRKD
ncbi:MAG TPA: hypothetical protein H9881_00720 [Candidatus Stackebrandtia excrementipullorum]|nr:hypothetical protein [Candidatus Stackebrandtia excrementipullorum]